MIKIERHHIKKGHEHWRECDFWCYVSKNLYNKMLYEVRQFALKEQGLFVDAGYEPVLGKNKSALKLHGKKDGKSFGIYQLTRLMQVASGVPEYRTKSHAEYGGRDLNTKILKQTLRQVEADFKTYFASVKALWDSKKKGATVIKGAPKKVRIPGYKQPGEKGRFTVTVPSEAISVKPCVEANKGGGSKGINTIAISPKSCTIKMDSKLTKEQILEIKIVPCSSGYDLLISYVDVATSKISKATKDASGNKVVSQWEQHKKEENQKAKEWNKMSNEHKIARAQKRADAAGKKLVVVGADPGIDSLVTLTYCDPGSGTMVRSPLIINGRHIKSINAYWNKRMAAHQSVISKAGLKSCAKMRQWTQKRSDRIRSALHKVSRWIVNDLMSTFDPSQYEVVFVMGVNKGWKQEVHLGSKTNQNFVQIPFGMLRSQLSYKLAEAHIDYIEQEEAYTSKCSFWDAEVIGFAGYSVVDDFGSVVRVEQYLGKRRHRGLFITKQGQLLNADVNGSGNIARKACAKVWSERQSDLTSNSVKGVSISPKRITLK